MAAVASPSGVYAVGSDVKVPEHGKIGDKAPSPPKNHVHITVAPMPQVRNPVGNSPPLVGRPFTVITGPAARALGMVQLHGPAPIGQRPASINFAEKARDLMQVESSGSDMQPPKKCVYFAVAVIIGVIVTAIIVASV